jgi:hypothetical protein
LFEKEVCYIPVGSDPWFYETKYYLTHGSTPHYLDPKKKRDKIFPISADTGSLCRKHYDGVFLRCLEKRDAEKVLFDLHDGPIGGHYGGDTTAHKILREMKDFLFSIVAGCPTTNGDLLI